MAVSVSIFQLRILVVAIAVIMIGQFVGGVVISSTKRRFSWSLLDAR
jgi:hypothetical protein